MRFLIVSATFLAIASAFLLYGLNYDTRRVEAEMHRLERSTDKARSDIAVLKAERAHLARPDRIEPAARAQGLAPVSGKQIVATGDAAAAGAR